MYTKELLDYIGDMSQIGGMKRYAYMSGKAKGVEAYDIDNGSGLQFTVFADRGMDIGRLSYRGVPVSFVSKTGVVSPFLYDGRGDEWLRSFYGGFLTTCGLTQVGDPCIYRGNEQGLHGRIGNTPAEEICATAEWENDAYIMKIRGKVRQAKLQHENLLLERTIVSVLGEDSLIIHDVVRNEGYVPAPLMILYHINFGYPLLNPNCDVVLPSRSVMPWDEASEREAGRIMQVWRPNCEIPECTYYHELSCDKHGDTEFLIADDKQSPRVAVAVSFNKLHLNNFVQWKNLKPGEYVMALEPCNNLVRGVTREGGQGTLKYLEPGESVELGLRVEFLSDRASIEDRKEAIRGLRE